MLRTISTARVSPCAPDMDGSLDYLFGERPPQTGARKASKKVSRQKRPKELVNRVDPRLVSWQSLSTIDCGCCSLTFRVLSDETLPARAHLVVKVNRRATGLRHRRLWATLRSAVEFNLNFSMSYDLRCPQPGLVFMTDLVRFHREHAATLDRHLKSVAFLVKDSFFVAVGERLLGSLVEVCSECCPCSIVHNPQAAEEFNAWVQLGSLPDVKAGYDKPSRKAQNSFMSIVEVRETVDGQPSKERLELQRGFSFAVLSPASWSSSPQDGKSLDDVEGQNNCDTYAVSENLMGHSSSDGSKKGQDADTVSMYTLPNGDVRVMQSLPTDVIVRQAPGLCSPEKSPKSRPLATPKRLPESPKKPPVAVRSHEDDAVDAPRHFALKFCCSQHALQQLLGAFFHMGELVVDAERESLEPSGTSRKWASDGEDNVKLARPSWLMRVVSWMC